MAIVLLWNVVVAYLLTEWNFWYFIVENETSRRNLHNEENSNDKEEDDDDIDSADDSSSSDDDSWPKVLWIESLTALLLMLAVADVWVGLLVVSMTLYVMSVALCACTLKWNGLSYQHWIR